MADSLRKDAKGALRRAPWGLLLLFLAGCARNEPFEVRLVELQERKLWRAGAEAFAADEYRAYLSHLRRAKDAVLARSPWRIAEHRQARFPGSARFYPRGALIARLAGFRLACATRAPAYCLPSPAVAIR